MNITKIFFIVATVLLVGCSGVRKKNYKVQAIADVNTSQWVMSIEEVFLQPSTGRLYAITELQNRGSGFTVNEKLIDTVICRLPEGKYTATFFVYPHDKLTKQGLRRRMTDLFSSNYEYSESYGDARLKITNMLDSKIVEIMKYRDRAGSVPDHE